MYQLSNPAAAIRGRIALYRGCLNRHETEVRLSMQDALQMNNYPAQAMQDMIDCALGNQIVEKTMVVRGAPIDLTRIRAPIFCGSGKADNTVPQSALLCSTNLISPRKATSYQTEGGHIGAVFGMGSLHSTWQTVGEWIRTT